MTNPSVTYTFVNGSAADATAVNQNFSDLINAMTDGTKTFNIDVLTCAGTATFNGAVTLGNATSDDVTITGYVAADVLSKTTNTYDLGASGRVWAEIHGTTLYTTTIEAISTAGIAIKGATDGSSASAGYVGEIKKTEPSSNTATNTSTATTVGSLTLTVGTWLVGAQSYSDNAATQTGADHYLYIKGVNGNVLGTDRLYQSAQPAGSAHSVTFINFVVDVATGDADKTVAVKQISFTANGAGRGSIRAVRIR